MVLFNVQECGKEVLCNFLCLLSMFLFDSCESKLGAVDGYPYPRHEQGAIMCTLAKLIMINTPIGEVDCRVLATVP